MMWSRNGRTNRPQNALAISKSPSSSAHSIVHHQQQFPFASTIFCAALIALIFGTKVEGRIRRESSSSSSHLPLSMDKEMFPPQDFDAEAPICLAEREPCGFYSFSLDGKAPLKWIKSWCRCSPKHECVYERTDMRMRVYRQTCVAKNDEQMAAMDEEGGGEMVQQQPKPTRNEEEERMAAVASSQENQTLAQTPGPSAAHHRHHHHHNRHNNHHGQQRRHARLANRPRVIRRLRAITLVD